MKRFLKFIKYHFWFWLIYGIGIVFYLCYKNYLFNQNDISKTLEVLQVYFLFVMFSGAWLFIYGMFIMNADIEDI